MVIGILNRNMVRDKLKNKDYFDEFLKGKNNLISNNEQALSAGEVAEKKVERAKYRNFGFRLESLVAEYSRGDSVQRMTNSIMEIIKHLPDETHLVNTKVKTVIGGETKFLDQYLLEPYERMLRLLSFAYLLDVSDTDFETVVRIIDRDTVRDNLYEFIIKSRLPNRTQKNDTEYDPKSVVSKVYKKLREAVVQSDLSEAAKGVGQFLKKDFYHKHTGFYDFHNNNLNLYYGYWSIEAAVITCILDLDDSSYRDSEFYPTDLVDYYRKKK